MGIFDSFISSAKNLFATEATEAKQSKKDLEKRLDADLTRREQELQATPEERMSMIQDEIDSSNASLEELVEKSMKQAIDKTDPESPS